MTEEQQSWGGDGLGPEDMAIPEIKLVQNVGGDTAKASGAKPGDFYCALTDEVIEKDSGFDLVIVIMQKNRTYWGRSDILDEPPECASLDAKSMKSINGDDCSTCEKRCEAPWLLSTDERRKMCLVNYNIIGITMPDLFPVLVRCSGLSAQAAKELYTQLALNKQLVGAWYKAKTHVSSIPKKSSAGEAFAMRFSKLELIADKGELEGSKVLSAQLMGTQVLLPEGRETTEAETETEPEPTAEDKTPAAASAGADKKPAKSTKAPTKAKGKDEPPIEEMEQPLDMDF